MKIAYTRKYFSLFPFLLFVVSSLIILTVSKGIYEGVTYWQEVTSVPSDYIVYYGQPKPTKANFAVGEKPRFNSFLEYKKEVDVYWRERQWCAQDDGVKKYEQTQRFPLEDYETKFPGTVNLDEDGELEFWEFYAYLADPQATECYVSSVVHLRTPKHGIEMSFPVITDSYGVNYESTNPTQGQTVQ